MAKTKVEVQEILQKLKDQKKTTDDDVARIEQSARQLVRRD